MNMKPLEKAKAETRYDKVVVFLLAVAATLVLLACRATSIFAPAPATGPAKPADVVGVWVQTVTHADTQGKNYTVEIEFMADGTFTQTITSANQNLATRQNGKWHLAGEEVTLENVLEETRSADIDTSPWQAGTTHWRVANTGIPNQPYVIYGGLGLEPFGKFKKIILWLNIVSSQDGLTYLVFDNDNGGRAGPALVDGKPWAYPIDVPGPISPGGHSLICGDTMGFRAEAGTTFHFYWGPELHQDPPAL